MGTIGDRINNPLDLFGQQSVYVKRWERPCSVSFLIHMQFKALQVFFEYGIYKYTPEGNTNKKSFHEIVKF